MTGATNVAIYIHMTPAEIRRLQRNRKTLSADQRDAIARANGIAFAKPAPVADEAAVARWAVRWSALFAEYDRARHGPHYARCASIGGGSCSCSGARS